MTIGIGLAESGWVPDILLRLAIRIRHSAVLKNEDHGSAEANQEALRAFIRSMHDQPIAAAPLESNIQHYEVPPDFFQNILGPWLKYSSCLWPEDQLGRRPRNIQAPSERTLLGRAEESMLNLTAQRAGIDNGMRILDLGCGWGSFTLWAAERFPQTSIIAVSNSSTQGEFIKARAKERRLSNVHAVTADMNHFQPMAEALPFDRIVSVEMFEHMANWPELLQRIAGWLTDNGLFFLHIFTHRELAYPFRKGPGQWMGEHFFSGGIMPADALLLHLQQSLSIVDHWRVSGLHYARTLDSWLSLLDAGRGAVQEILAQSHGRDRAALQLTRWRLFLMACSELFSYRAGNEWLVSHYLMSKRPHHP